MVSFRDAVPPTNPADMATLAQLMKLRYPVSLSNLIGKLTPPSGILFSTPTLGPSTITGSAQWSLNAQGIWHFWGSVEESGVLGQDYVFAMTLNVKDANGNGFAVTTDHGSVGPNLPGFSNTDSFDREGFEQRIADNWPAIFGASPSWKLEVTTDVKHVLEGLGETLVAVIVVGAMIIAGKNMKCDPAQANLYQDDHGGPGVEIRWNCYPSN